MDDGRMAFDHEAIFGLPPVWSLTRIECVVRTTLPCTSVPCLRARWACAQRARRESWAILGRIASPRNNLLPGSTLLGRWPMVADPLAQLSPLAMPTLMMMRFVFVICLFFFLFCVALLFFVFHFIHSFMFTTFRCLNEMTMNY
jgi:hypothetical protein